MIRHICNRKSLALRCKYAIYAVMVVITVFVWLGGYVYLRNAMKNEQNHWMVMHISYFVADYGRLPTNIVELARYIHPNLGPDDLSERVKLYANAFEFSDVSYSDVMSGNQDFLLSVEKDKERQKMVNGLLLGRLRCIDISHSAFGDGPWSVPHVPFMFSRHFDLIEECVDEQDGE